MIVGRRVPAALDGAVKMGGVKTEEDLGMSLSELQANLRHVAAERDWQPLDTAKSVSTAR
jgi:hypothetical protein